MIVPTTIVWVTHGLPLVPAHPPPGPFRPSAARRHARTRSTANRPRPGSGSRGTRAGRSGCTRVPVSRSGMVEAGLRRRWPLAVGRSAPQTRRRRKSAGSGAGAGRMRTLTSTATAPCSDTITGFRSISLTSGTSSARRRDAQQQVLERGDVDRGLPAVAEQQRANRAASGPPRAASSSVIGTIRSVRSASSSAVTPPNPNSTSGPNDGSWVTPTIVSTPGRGHALHDRAAHRRRRGGRAIAANAARTAAASARRSATPPTSVLCTRSRRAGLQRDGIAELRRRRSPASSAVATSRGTSSGMPKQPSKRRRVGARRASTPSGRRRAAGGAVRRRVGGPRFDVDVVERGHGARWARPRQSARSAARPSACAAASGNANDGTVRCVRRRRGARRARPARPRKHATTGLAPASAGRARDRVRDVVGLGDERRHEDREHRVDTPGRRARRAARARTARRSRTATRSIGLRTDASAATNARSAALGRLGQLGRRRARRPRTRRPRGCPGRRRCRRSRRAARRGAAGARAPARCRAAPRACRRG